MRSPRTAAATLAAVLFVAVPQAASAAVPEPVFDGVVVQDVTRSYSFDHAFLHPCCPEPSIQTYEGSVRSQVIHDSDGSYDFYFHITVATGGIAQFRYQWQTPANATIAHHAYDAPDALVLAGVSTTAAGFDWITEQSIFANGLLREAVILIDTDARAYAMTGSYKLGDNDRYAGVFYSPSFATFAPAIPEPGAWALMLVGLGLVGLAERRRARRI